MSWHNERMLYLAEYDRPAHEDFPEDDHFEAMFDAPNTATTRRNELDPAMADWIVDYGRANGATHVTVSTYEPHRLGRDGYRHPPSRRYITKLPIPELAEARR